MTIKNTIICKHLFKSHTNGRGFYAKVLRSFTKFLLDNSEIGEQTYWGSLFRIIKIANPTPITKSSPEPVELQIMNKLTRLLIGEDMNKREYFSLLKILIDVTYEMDTVCLKPYLTHIQEIIIKYSKNRKLKKLGDIYRFVQIKFMNILAKDFYEKFIQSSRR